MQCAGACGPASGAGVYAAGYSLPQVLALLWGCLVEQTCVAWLVQRTVVRLHR